MQAIQQRSSMRASAVRARPAARRVVVTKAALEPSLVISGSTAAFLTIGRFVFLPWQRSSGALSDACGPKATGNSFSDNLSKPATAFVTNDPAGFTIIDVAGWGALGHAFGFAALALNSLQNL
ncbi:hypothetical protein HYH03_018186 [Edaphochlamys debaryana]|uniref:PSI-G n=1 Tax=Edaphochlamys debaryana TaxID=47281 RepID=A0A836BPN0_9CHLO|nr:hypothetical protein HYH03_018186 [Edaphochlamys debaryana]|eukprot:KAG2482904.1 hypothetical protein HYH03_018186 [Edaphochlamys debaryana]